MITKPSLALLLCASINLIFAAPPIIDDMMLVENFSSRLGKLVGTEGVPSADDLCMAAKEASPRKTVALLPDALKNDASNPVNDYEHLSKSVYLVGTVFKCGKCENWHRGGNATAWCVGADGIMVTNAHVFLAIKGAAMGISDREGNCYPVTELLGIDPLTDVAVFRVKGEGFLPLRLGSTANVGDPVSIISNPANHNFMRTTGSVARYVNQPVSRKSEQKVVWMAVTADYAKGSSGGPIFNQAGEVVGMVSKTKSIYTQSTEGKPKGETPKGELQMVIRHCVPLDAIRALFTDDSSASSEKL